MIQPRLFRFYAENLTTKEKAEFIGQGCTLDEAWRDAINVLNDTFRPNSDGKTTPGKNKPNRLGVLIPSGERVTRLLKEFEGAEAYRP